MTNTPCIHERAEQPYVALHLVVTMTGFGAAIDAGFPELFGWLGRRGIAPAGAPLIRYLAIDMAAEMEIELAVPISAADAAGLSGDDRIRIGALPAGRYATLLHVGPYDGLMASNAALQEWATQHGVAFDVSPSDSGERWGARIEIYTTNPAEEPDPAKFEVDVSYRLAD
jgi:effector-binding domain-containing protein